MKPPTQIQDIPRFDCVIDARSPAEFALDHIPGAINCPVLDDSQRHIVGTLYKQQGAFEARRLGGAMVAENLARHLRQRFQHQPAHWKPLVYCWRGGLRSGSMTQWLRLVGWDAQQLQGGYKAWRRHVIYWIDTRVPHLRLRVLVGATGSAKTLLLQALAAQGEQVLDLEALAVHKGSVLGNVPGRTQPSQTAFETGLVHTLQLLDPQRTIWVEGESRKIGKVALPQALVDRLRAAPCVEIEATAEARLAYLLRDYAYLGDDRTALAERLGWLKGLHSNETLARWQAWARQGELPALFRELMQAHYDPLYARSQASHFALWPQRQKLWTDDLSEAAVGALATAARALPSAG